MKKFTIACLLSFMLVILLAGCSKSDTKAKRQVAACTANQKQIIISLMLYANENPDKKLPQDLSQLIHDQQVLSCPKSSSSYTILPGVTLAALQSSDSTIPVICCQAHPDVAVIGYADGHVETITGPLPAAVK